ncbi:Dyp-type peroxidase [Actinokineospora spheciospongiae]|uniref:Dyp-type peroxidase n=1 Tax=Actinokineospora spheciospongiae TaxID=909613 RepID=UPI001F3F02DE|nr:Dyp-type peroxidase [Actinokineospora spheciospongiae]
MNRHPSRRTFLGAAGAAVTAGLVAGCESRSGGPPGRPAPAAQPPATGEHQAGIAEPRDAQPNLLAVVADLDDTTAVGPLLAELGRTVLALTAGTDPRLLGLAPGDLTVTVGIGPRVVRLADPALPGAADLPPFAREQVADRERGGDLLVQVCASEAPLLSVAAAALLGRAGVRERWRQSGRRGPGTALAEGRTAPRNQLGFVDGIVGPHTPAERQRDLWLAAPPPVAGGTIAVLRRMELDLPRFAGLSTSDQEAVIGRHRDTGAPLSGGPAAAGPDLAAKTPDGRYLVPADAHARRAHAGAIGVGLMLRRSYSTDDPAPGLLFISFQNDLRTFTTTLTHMERSDALLPFTTTTASATFLVLPGFDRQRPLGSTLFPAG